jgi:cytochrome c556
MIEAWISGPLGVILGAAIAYGISWRDARKAAREQLLRQMQALVVAVGELRSARALFDAEHVGARARYRAGFTALTELYSLWSGQGRTWTAAAAALGPVARYAQDWDRSTVAGAREVVLATSRVAAAGLPLGMCEDQRIAEAAQQLMDAAIEGRADNEIESAVRALRHAFYPNESASA